MTVLEIEPIVRWPRRMTPGLAYLVEVDLVHAGHGTWPYDDEELTFTIMLSGGPWITVEALGDSALILHRFGGTYGPARFVAVADEAVGPRSLWLNLLTERGVIARTDELPTLVARSKPDRAEETTFLPDITRRVLSRTLRSGVQHFVMIEVAPAGVRMDTYHTTLWSQVESDYPVTLLVDDEPRRLEDVPNVVAPVLRELADRIPATSELSVEFILPRRLLGYPVDEWSFGDVRLGHRWPVVVRSLERIRSRDLGLHRRWRARWRRLHDPRPARTYMIEAPGSNMVEPMPEETSFVLFDPRSGAPNDDALRNMLGAGIPAMLWARNGRGSAASLPMVNLEREVRRLPQYVHGLRQETTQPRSEPFRLSLLWDDPDRLPQSPTMLQFPR